LAHDRDALLGSLHAHVRHELQRRAFDLDRLDDLALNFFWDQRAAAWNGSGGDAVVWRNSTL